MDAPRAEPHALPRRALHALFVASGAVGLVYEVLWMRRFADLFGATAPAAAATLCAFFAGLAAGSAVLGPLAHRLKRPLLGFAALEAGIGLTALLVEPLLALGRSLWPWLGGMGADRPALQLALRMALGGAALLPPTFLMGGSLPVLGQALVRARASLGAEAGGLYAANTLGAAAGSLSVPLLLLPAFGGPGALVFAVATSLAIALAAALLHALARRAPPSPAGARPGRPASRTGDGPGWSQRSVLAAALLSGLVALALQVLWTRMLALVHESSVHSFAVVVAVCLAGIALGAALARVLLRRGARPARLVAVGWIAAGALVVATPRLFAAATSGLQEVAGASLIGHELRIAGLALLAVLPAATLASLALPALVQAWGAGADRPAGEALGGILAVNTIGALAGPPLALFVLGPALGLWGAMALLGIVLAAAGVLALPRSSGPLTGSSGPLPRLGGVLAAAGVALALGATDAPRVRLIGDQRVVSIREGPFGTVAVVDADTGRRLVLDNHYVLGGTGSTGDERLQAHVPLLLHPRPRSAAFLGLGTGITASGTIFHPLSQVTAWELVPEVVEAAAVEFREANLDVLHSKPLRVVADDARTGLRGLPGAFDVIVGDLVVPWRRGEAALYTRETFEAARGALAPGGLYCQWLPLFQLREEDFDAIAATFLDVFPRTVLVRGDFRAGEPALGLVGLTVEALDVEAADARVRELAATPDPDNPYLVHPAGLWAYVVGPLSPDDPRFRAAPRNTTAHPVVELEAPAVHVSRHAHVPATFSHRRLETYLDSVLARALAGTPLEGLGAERAAWRQAGADIWKASLLDLEGRREEADALGFAALDRLPAEVRASVFGQPAD